MSFSLSKSDRTEKFCPSRFISARRRRGLAIGQLAKLLDVDRNTVARYETGQFSPTSEHLIELARTLRFPPRFFLCADIGTFLLSATSIRGRSTLSARQFDIAIGSACLAIAFNNEAERYFALPETKLPNYPGQTPERSAELLKGRWDLDGKSVGPLLPLLEEQGVRIFSVPPDIIAVGSFSFWHQGVPHIFLNNSAPNSSLREDLATELGHLVLHREVDPISRSAHHAAQQFAEAFLLPASDMRKLGAIADVINLSDISAKLGVPAMMLTNRLHRLKLLSDWKFRELRLALDRHEDVADRVGVDAGEQPQLLPKVFKAFAARGVTRHKFPHVLGIYPKDVDELTFGVALHMLLEGQKIAGLKDALRPSLKIVR